MSFQMKKMILNLLFIVLVWLKVIECLADIGFNNDGSDSFYDYANRRSQFELTRELLDKSMSLCPYASVDLARDRVVRNFSRKNFPLKSFKQSNKTVDRLFLLNDFTVGVVSSVDQAIVLYRAQLTKKIVYEYSQIKFINEIPTDACADLNENIYIVFPSQNKIMKYINRENSSNISIVEAGFEPNSIACYDQDIYVSQRGVNNHTIRVYNSSLDLIRTIRLNGTYFTAEKALAVDQNLHVFLDGRDSLTFVPNSDEISKIRLMNRTIIVCRFYNKMTCLKDVSIAKANNSPQSSIYALDTCNREVKEYIYKRGEKIKLINNYKIDTDELVSVKVNSYGYMFALTNKPAQLHLIKMNA
jgi:hypothetical protein